MIQLQMIDKTKSIAQNDKNISAVFMYGSFTKNEGDKYSDIEFYIFLKDKENFSAENWVAKFILWHYILPTSMEVKLPFLKI